MFCWDVCLFVQQYNICTADVATDVQEITFITMQCEKPFKKQN